MSSATAQVLAATLRLDEAKLAKQLDEARCSASQFLWIARRLDAETAGKIELLHLPGVHLQQEPKRFYPNGSLAAHVLGFVGLDNAGLAGIEHHMTRRSVVKAESYFLREILPAGRTRVS